MPVPPLYLPEWAVFLFGGSCGNLLVRLRLLPSPSTNIPLRSAMSIKQLNYSQIYANNTESVIDKVDLSKD